MKYGTITPNEIINADIYRCFDFLSEADQKSFVKDFRNHQHDNRQAMHTLRELILGTYLASKGYTVARNRKIRGKTPDWSIVDNGALTCIVEVRNFHTTDAAINSAIHAEIASQPWTFIYQPDHTERLHEKLEEKSSKYRDIVAEHDVPYVVALFGAFDAAVSPDQVDRSLYGDQGLFQAFPHVSGVLFFHDSKGFYEFEFHPNPAATRPFALPGGALPASFFRSAAPATD
jgi:hypothetical protein